MKEDMCLLPSFFYHVAWNKHLFNALSYVHLEVPIKCSGRVGTVLFLPLSSYHWFGTSGNPNLVMLRWKSNDSCGDVCLCLSGHSQSNRSRLKSINYQVIEKHTC